MDKELRRTKEVFINTHYQKYGAHHRPPAYKSLEVISFGCLSKLYANLDNKIVAKDRIAKEMNLPNSSFLTSWLKTFNLIRNIIAHHSRIWNRKVHFAPKFLHSTAFQFIEKPDSDQSMYYCTSCILFVLNKVSPGHSIKEKLIELFENCTPTTRNEVSSIIHTVVTNKRPCIFPATIVAFLVIGATLVYRYGTSTRSCSANCKTTHRLKSIRHKKRRSMIAFNFFQLSFMLVLGSRAISTTRND
jgi:hypothetical protein